MCGIAGIVSLDSTPVPDLARRLETMGKLIAHRGPDGHGIWTNHRGSAGFAHRRLAIIDLTESAAQPMVKDEAGLALVHNGEIYNYRELRETLASDWRFTSHSDTETILAAYARHGDACLDQLRGMFAFAVWDERQNRLLCARDRFGIKPLYYAVIDGALYFASEAKALVPFLPAIETDPEALAEYLTFQYTIGTHTLFRGVEQLLPGHTLTIERGQVRTQRYWDVSYEIDFDHTASHFRRRLRELLDESLALHLRSDVPVGSYLSGGIDSSLVGMLAARHESTAHRAFHGKFTDVPGYDESRYAELVARDAGLELYQLAITSHDFRDHIAQVIYHLDFPVAGPGSFPQYMVSKLASRHVKVVLGGQGGDEIFGGYARYLLAYFEQCIRAAIDGTSQSGNYVVTLESILPNLGVLREYQPMIKEFWREGLFGPLDARYFRLIDRSTDMTNEVDWAQLDKARVFESFRAIFNNPANVPRGAYFDSMTHFDFKCLLPALLQVEDRMSMAHGLEARVPLLDHPLVELAARVPADVKFEGGQMKRLLKTTFDDVLPRAILDRRDKMGFPVPLKEWFDGGLSEFLQDTFRSQHARHRPGFNHQAILDNVSRTARYSRTTWGLLSLELWHQRFHDRAAEWRQKAS